MHYIRFLRTPKVEVEKGVVLLNAVITLTTDLGETFFPQDLELIATVRDTEQDGDIYLRRKLRWPGGARSLPVTFDLSRQDVDWPACMHIAVRSFGPVPPVGFLPPIVDVWSGTMNPTNGHFESGWRVERRFTSLAERTVSLLEDAGDSIARHLWDGSQALAQHIDQTISLQMASNPLPLLEYVLVSATYRRLNVIELGCGCGSVGISLAQSIPDCNVLLTDLPEVTELVEANIERMKPAMSSEVHFESLDWEQPLPEKLRNRINGLIIVSECTYNTDTLQPLVNTLQSLIARSPKAVIVVSTKTRHDSEAAFFDLMRDAGFIEGGSMRIPLPGEPGNGYADWAGDIGLHVFHGREHRFSLSAKERSAKRSAEGVPKVETSRRPRSR
ncbi:hypothetical protein B0A55_07155 [Friedmanniomyces simplex]|uniref:Methyltransferase domain-containing protein n=2 Tax=Friedmanniomyces simplex TaxID=329884 RepID=A0A4U0XAT5_9PEZI|nr:hypothetical protein B0A55_07155 [Friedmanniomyces simplex]